MTQIKFDFGHPSADGITDLAGETVHVIPTSRFNSGKRIVVRDSFDVKLDAHGTATITVPPTDNTFAYEVTIGDSTDSWRFARTVQVPDSSDPVDFDDLTDVDEGTLAPTLNKGAALTYLLASSLQEAQTLSAANPGQMVFYPEGVGKAVASQILEDLTDTRAVVEAQSAVAAQAANSAQAASVQASQAAQQVSEQSAQVSAQSEQVADTVSTVQSVADSIAESKTVVESKASDALTAIDEAVRQVKGKASDATGEDKTEDKAGTPAEVTPDATDTTTADSTSQEA